MNQNQVFQLLKRINSFYPNRLPKDPAEVDEMVKAYHVMLVDEDIEWVLINLKDHIKNNPHPPTIADLLGNTLKKHDDVRIPIPNAKETLVLLEQKRLPYKRSEDDEMAIELEKAKIRKILGI